MIDLILDIGGKIVFVGRVRVFQPMITDPNFWAHCSAIAIEIAADSLKPHPDAYKTPPLSLDTRGATAPMPKSPTITRDMLSTKALEHLGDSADPHSRSKVPQTFPMTGWLTFPINEGSPQKTEIAQWQYVNTRSFGYRTEIAKQLIRVKILWGYRLLENIRPGGTNPGLQWVVQKYHPTSAPRASTLPEPRASTLPAPRAPTPPPPLQQEPPRYGFDLARLLRRTLTSLISSAIVIKNEFHQGQRRTCITENHFVAVFGVEFFSYEPDTAGFNDILEINEEVFYFDHTSHSYVGYPPNHPIFYRDTASGPWIGPSLLGRWVFFDPHLSGHYGFPPLSKGRIFPDGIFNWLLNQKENSGQELAKAFVNLWLESKDFPEKFAQLGIRREGKLLHVPRDINSLILPR